MSFIVSANYVERDSAFRWLFRPADGDLGQAVAARYLHCEGVRFCVSPESERGFGCAIVAECEKVSPALAAPTTAALDAVEVRFDVDKFVAGKSRREVRGADRLELRSSGQVFVIGPDYADREGSQELAAAAG